jgi:hypothetical protein
LVNSPAIFVAPAAITVASGEIWIAVSGSDNTYGGCHIWASNDGSHYLKVGTLKGESTHGFLTAALPTGADTDTTNTVAIELFNGEIESVSQKTVDTHDSRCFVGGEFLAYRDAVLTAANCYDLSYLKRGLYSSMKGAANSAAFVLLNDRIFKYRFNQNLVSETVYFKFQAFNLTGGGLQDLADLVEYSFTIDKSGGVKALLSDIPNVSGFESKKDKVSAWSEIPNHTNYPSEKLVADTFATFAVSGGSSSTHYEVVTFDGFNEDVVYLNEDSKVPNFVTDDTGDLFYMEVPN